MKALLKGVALFVGVGIVLGVMGSLGSPVGKSSSLAEISSPVGKSSSLAEASDESEEFWTQPEVKAAVTNCYVATQLLMKDAGRVSSIGNLHTMMMFALPKTGSNTSKAAVEGKAFLRGKASESGLDYYSVAHGYYRAVCQQFMQ